MIDAPALPPPAVVGTCAARGLLRARRRARAPRGTQARDRQNRRARPRRPAAARDVVLVATCSCRRRRSRSVSPPSTGSAAGRRASSSHVRGLPHGSEPRQALSRLDPALARTVRSLTRRAGGTSAVYVQDLRTGRGAAWNAGARFPAASTLKLAIARHDPALASTASRQSGTRLDRPPRRDADPLRQRVRERARGLARRLDVGRLRARQRDDARSRAERLTHVRRLRDDRAGRRPATPIPIRVESQPAFGLGKYTTAWDLARLARRDVPRGSRQRPAARTGRQRLGGSLPAVAARAGGRPRQARSLSRLRATSSCTRPAGSRPHATTTASLPSRAARTWRVCMTWRAAAADQLAGADLVRGVDRFRR